MSLVSTLGKVAFGLIVAQATKKLTGGRGGALGGLLGAVLGGGATRSSAIAGGIGALLSSLLAGKSAQASTNTSSASSSNASSGNVLSNLFGLLGGSPQSQTGTGGRGLGDLFKAAINQEPINPTKDDERNAEVLLRAMINSVKADGVIDDNEQQKIKEYLKDASQSDINFVTSELKKPLDLPGLIRDVPKGLEQQVYVMSLLAMTLDDPKEVAYMKDLAAGLNISTAQRNEIHDQLQIPHLA